MIEEDRKTLWCGNLAEQVTEELLYELFLQAGPLEKVRIPKDKDGRQKQFAFITYCHEVSVPYAMNLFRGTALFNKTLMLQSRGVMTLLPPPIRCMGPEPQLEIQPIVSQQFAGLVALLPPPIRLMGPEPQLEFQPNVPQQFAEMAERIRGEDLKMINVPRGQDQDMLVMASLQGNWSHRHHPYRGKEKVPGDHRARDSYNAFKGRDNRSQSNWRDRRNHKRGNYHRRD